MMHARVAEWTQEFILDMQQCTPGLQVGMGAAARVKSATGVLWGPPGLCM